MNARDPLLPIQADEAEQLGRFAEEVMPAFARGGR